MKKLFLYMLILLNVNLYGQSTRPDCDSIVYLMIPQLPAFFGDFTALEKHLSQNIENPIKSILKQRAIIFELTVNCIGQVSLSNEGPSLESLRVKLEDSLNDLVWVPGRSKNIARNFQTGLLIYYENNDLRIKTDIKELRGQRFSCIIIDEETGSPVENVLLKTDYNGQRYYSDELGKIEFYCDPLDIVKVDHVYYNKQNIKSPNNKDSIVVKLSKRVFDLETLNLKTHSPKKLPYKEIECNFDDYFESENSNGFIVNENNYSSSLAMFKQGDWCFFNYITKEFVFPEAALNENYTENVQIKFLVNENGEISNISFDKKLKHGLKNEFIRIFEESPMWKPAKQARIKTKQWFSISIIIGKNRYWKKYYG